MEWDIDILDNEVQKELEKAEEYAEDATETLQTLNRIKVPENFRWDVLYILSKTCLIEELIKDATYKVERKIVDLKVAESKNNEILNEILNDVLKEMTLEELKEELWYLWYGAKEEDEEGNKEAIRWLQEYAREIEETKNMNADEFFEKYGTIGYGIDQGLLRMNYFEYDGSGGKQTYGEYEELVEMARDKYNMSEKDAAILIESVDSTRSM